MGPNQTAQIQTHLASRGDYGTLRLKSTKPDLELSFWPFPTLLAKETQEHQGVLHA